MWTNHSPLDNSIGFDSAYPKDSHLSKSNQINLFKPANVRSGCPISEPKAHISTWEHSGSNWNFEVLVFLGEGKIGVPEETTLGEEKRINNKLDPHDNAESGNRTPGARFSKVTRTFRARKASRKTTTCLFCKAGLFICCKGNKNKNNCKVSCLETSSCWRYKENYVTRNTPEKFRYYRETGPWSHWCSHQYTVPAPLLDNTIQHFNDF